MAHNYTSQVVAIGGAFYRKVTSSRSARWKGIRAQLVLPTPIFEGDRLYGGDQGENRLNDHTAGPLDRPSVYIGGNGDGREVDCGLSWDRVWAGQSNGSFTDRDELTDGGDPSHRFRLASVAGERRLLDGTGSIVAVGAEALRRAEELNLNFAFRPYFRDRNNSWITPQPPGSDNDRYFYPGETVLLSVKYVQQDFLQFTVSSADGTRGFEVTVESDGFGPNSVQSFKRVNALDQFRTVNVSGTVLRQGNERPLPGRPRAEVLPTQARVLDLHWQSVEMITKDGASVPVTGPSFTEVIGWDLETRYDRVFVLSGQTADGGERVDIEPSA